MYFIILVLENFHTTLFKRIQKMFLLFLGDFDLLIPMLNNASAKMLSVLRFGCNNPSFG